MPIMPVPLPTITLLPDGLVELRNEEGTSLLIDPEDNLFDADDLGELKNAVELYLFELGLNTWGEFFEPGNTAVRAQYDARSNINVRRRGG